MARILIGNIKGPQGIQGNKGDKGDTGPRGPAGPPGLVDNTTPIEFTEAAQRENLVSGDSIATLFGKQKKWNADIEGGLIPYVPTFYVIHDSSNSEEAKRKLDNPTLLLGERQSAYCILFEDRVGGSGLGGGLTCVYGYTYSTGSHGCQIALNYYSGGKFKVRNRSAGGWSNWANVYDAAYKPTPADIGAVSAEVESLSIPAPEENEFFNNIANWSLRVFKQGNIVSIISNIDANFKANSDFVRISNIPQEYRPRQSVIVNYISQKNNAMIFQVGNNGDVFLYNNNTDVSGWICRQCVTFVIG